MADPLALATNLVRGIVSRVKVVKRNHEECRLLGSLAEKTLSALETLEAKALSDPTATTAVDRVYEALNEADKAVESCCTATFLYASLYSDDYSSRLQHAAAALENSLAQTSLASIGMTAEIQSQLAALSNQIRYARVEERAKTAEQTQALKDAFERAFNQHGQDSEEVKSIIRELIQQQSSSADELRNELTVLKEQAYEANTNKEKQREFELNQIIGVLSESLVDAHEAPRVLHDLKDHLCCPISKEVMRDPVILKDSGKAYDRSSITKWLRLGHRYDPLTNVELVSRELIPNSALRDACQVLSAQSAAPSTPLDDLGIEDSERRIELGLYEGHGDFSIDATIIHTIQLLILGPNGVVVGCTLYAGADLGSQESTLEIGAGKWDSTTHELCFGDSRFNYLGNVEIKRNIQKQTIVWIGKVSKVEALNQKYNFELDYTPPPVGYEVQARPTILEMSGEIDTNDANIKYISKLCVALERDKGINGWVSFESSCHYYNYVGQVANGSWDKNQALQFLIYFAPSNTPLNSDLKPTNYTACFSVVGTISHDESLSRPSFSGVVNKVQRQEKAESAPLDSLKFIQYSLIREASTPWHYLHPNPLKLFQLSRNFELESSEYVSKASLDARYSLIPHSQRAFGRSPLHIASENNHVQIVKELIAKRVDINFKDYNGQTPLHLALSTNSIDVIKELLSKNATIDDKDNCGKTPLHIAIEKNHLSVIKILLVNGANMDLQDDNGWTLLHRSSKNNDICVVKGLIANGANINIRANNGYTPLHVALENNSIDAINELNANGANIECQDIREWTPLHQAIMEESIDVAKELIAKGANINAQDENGMTPLHWAIDKDSIDVAKILIEKGATIDLQDKNGFTPLHRSLYNNSRDVAKMLIEKGATINHQDKNGETPLHHASYNNSTDVAKMLIEKGAIIDHQDKNGDTPLYVASRVGYVSIANILLEHGASKTIANNRGETPFDVICFYAYRPKEKTMQDLKELLKL